MKIHKYFLFLYFFLSSTKEEMVLIQNHQSLLPESNKILVDFGENRDAPVNVVSQNKLKNIDSRDNIRIDPLSHNVGFVPDKQASNFYAKSGSVFDSTKMNDLYETPGSIDEFGQIIQPTTQQIQMEEIEKVQQLKHQQELEEHEKNFEIPQGNPLDAIDQIPEEESEQSNLEEMLENQEPPKEEEEYPQKDCTVDDCRPFKKVDQAYVQLADLKAELQEALDDKGEKPLTPILMNGNTIKTVISYLKHLDYLNREENGHEIGLVPKMPEKKEEDILALKFAPSDKEERMKNEIIKINENYDALQERRRSLVIAVAELTSDIEEKKQLQGEDEELLNLESEKQKLLDTIQGIDNETFQIEKNREIDAEIERLKSTVIDDIDEGKLDEANKIEWEQKKLEHESKAVEIKIELQQEIFDLETRIETIENDQKILESDSEVYKVLEEEKEGLTKKLNGLKEEIKTENIDEKIEEELEAESSHQEDHHQETDQESSTGESQIQIQVSKREHAQVDENHRDDELVELVNGEHIEQVHDGNYLVEGGHIEPIQEGEHVEHLLEGEYAVDGGHVEPLHEGEHIEEEKPEEQVVEGLSIEHLIEGDYVVEEQGEFGENQAQEGHVEGQVTDAEHAIEGENLEHLQDGDYVIEGDHVVQGLEGNPEHIEHLEEGNYTVEVETENDPQNHQAEGEEQHEGEHIEIDEHQEGEQVDENQEFHEELQHLPEGDYILDGENVVGDEHVVDGEIVIDVEPEHTGPVEEHLEEGDYLVDGENLEQFQEGEKIEHLIEGEYVVDGEKLDHIDEGGQVEHLEEGEYIVDGGHVDELVDQEHVEHLNEGEYIVDGGHVEVLPEGKETVEGQHVEELHEGEYMVDGPHLQRLVGTEHQQHLEEGDYVIYPPNEEHQEIHALEAHHESEVLNDFESQIEFNTEDEHEHHESSEEHEINEYERVDYTKIDDYLHIVQELIRGYLDLFEKIPENPDSLPSLEDENVKLGLDIYNNLRKFVVNVNLNFEHLENDVKFVEEEVSSVDLSHEDIINFYSFGERFHTVNDIGDRENKDFIKKHEELNEATEKVITIVDNLIVNLKEIEEFNDLLHHEIEFIKNEIENPETSTATLEDKIRETLTSLPKIMNIRNNINENLGLVQENLNKVLTERVEVSLIIDDLELINEGKYFSDDVDVLAKEVDEEEASEASEDSEDGVFGVNMSYLVLLIAFAFF